MLGETLRRTAQDEHPGLGGRRVHQRDLLEGERSPAIAADPQRDLNPAQRPARDHPTRRQFNDGVPGTALKLIDRNDLVEQRVEREVQPVRGGDGVDLGQSPWVCGRVEKMTYVWPGIGVE